MALPLQEAEMIEPPTRADLANSERMARRILGSSQNQDIRALCKAHLGFVKQIDEFVESLYPCFDLVENEIRQNKSSLCLDDDGVFRIKKTDGTVLISGKSLKDLFVNMVLFHGDWENDEFLEQCALEEDEIFEPDRRKTKKSAQ